VGQRNWMPNCPTESRRHWKQILCLFQKLTFRSLLIHFFSFQRHYELLLILSPKTELYVSIKLSMFLNAYDSAGVEKQNLLPNTCILPCKEELSNTALCGKSTSGYKNKYCNIHKNNSLQCLVLNNFHKLKTCNASRK
jgi:hypothetical protein